MGPYSGVTRRLHAIFVASIVGSLLLVLWAWYSSLFECQGHKVFEDIGMRELFGRVFTAERLSPDSANGHKSAVEGRPSYLVCDKCDGP